MDIFGNLLSKVGLERKRGSQGMRGIELYSTGVDDALFRPGEPVPYNRLLQEARGWVYACVRVIAEEVGLTPLELYKVAGKSEEGGVEWERIHDHPFMDLLNAPNPNITAFEFMEIISMHLDLTGNAFIWLQAADGNGVKNAEEIPAAMWPLPPDNVRPDRTALPKFINGYIFEDNFSKRRLEPHEVLHIKEPNPNDLYMGMGATQAAADAIDQDNWARAWNRQFFQNGAWPGIIVKSGTTNEDKLQQIRAAFDGRHRGVNRSHKAVILPAGVELDTIGVNQKDMDFANMRLQARDEILGLFRVPHVALGLGAGEELNRATADTTDYIFGRRTIRPKVRRIVNFINEFLLPRFGDDLMLDFADQVSDDMEYKRSLHKDALMGSPYMSVNEVRDDLGLQPIEGGDEVLGNPMLWPIGETGGDQVIEEPGGEAGPEGEDEQVAAARPARVKDMKAPVGQVTDSNGRKKILRPSRHVKNALKRKEQKAAIEAAVEKNLAIELAKIKKDRGVNPKRQTEYRTRINANVVPFEREVRGAMNRYHRQMAQRAIANLPTIVEENEKKAVKRSQILDRNDEIADVIDALKPIMQELSMKQGELAANLVGMKVDVNKIWGDALQRNLNRMASKYATETLTLLQADLEEGIKDGEGIDALTDRVGKLVEWSDEVRSNRVATTETFRASNLAARQTWQQLEVVKTLVWHVQSDNPCTFCQAMNGKEVGVDQVFYEKGQTITGADGSTKEIDYAEGTDPNVHPNCQCVILPGKIEISESNQ